MQAYPTRLKIEHTSFCNAQCIMCSHFFSANHDTHMIDDKLEERIAPILKHVRRILLQGSGEPLAHPHIAEYIRNYASMGIETTCNTNLSIMTPELSEAIKQGFRKISVSCDGCTAEIFEGIRKGLHFETFKRNLIFLRKHCPELVIKMYTVAMRQNLTQLPEIVSFAHAMGCNAIVITDLNPKELLDNEKDMIRNYPTVAKHYLQKAVDTARSLQFPIDYPKYILKYDGTGELSEDIAGMQQYPMFASAAFQKSLQKFFSSLNYENYSTLADEKQFIAPSGYHCRGICNYLTDEPYIDAKGNVFPCCANGQYHIGNIYESSFEEIWDNVFYRGLRKLFSEGELPMYCKGCLYLRNHYLDDVEILDADEHFYRQQYNTDLEGLVQEFKDFCAEIDG